LITSTDVIHSFSVPSLGLKVDALPGRINQIFSAPSRIGIFFGQCSEICGSNHSFIPIRIKVSNIKDFDLIIINKTLDLILD
jgi:cytochrome c oxidase subunit 2